MTKMTDKTAPHDAENATAPGAGQVDRPVAGQPEPRLWYDPETQKCSSMVPLRPTYEPLWDDSDMHAYAAACVAAERERCAKVAEGFEQTRDWVPGSLYDNIRREVAARIRRA